MMKQIAILGSTGSVGRQALQVVRMKPGDFRITVLGALHLSAELVMQAGEFKPEIVVVADDDVDRDLSAVLKASGIRLEAGVNASGAVMTEANIDLVLNAIVGYAGFEPTLCALMAGKTLALANKESLVVGGELVTSVAKEKNARIIPVDSEHSAIFQCLLGESVKDLRKIILTASGGPFLDYSPDRLRLVKPAEALRHPTWNMGDKISVDSATLMNKGLEVIEARWLFDVDPTQLEVLIHPQSIVHSLVEFVDGSVKAQLGIPDMRLPIAYALSFPGRTHMDLRGLDLAALGTLTFSKPRTEIFRNLALAFEALKSGGNMSCILNAANEVAVGAFLSEKISLTAISEIIEQCLAEISYIKAPQFGDYVDTDLETRKLASALVNDWTHK